MARRLLNMNNNYKEDEMELQLQYGDGTIEVKIPKSVDVAILEPKLMDSISSIENCLYETLRQAGEQQPDILPIVNDSQTVAIAIPDASRPLPTAEVLPPLLNWLFTKIPGLSPEQIYIIIGCGLHANNEDETVEHLAPQDLPQGCNIIFHDAFNSQTEYLGTTPSGTPVLINDRFVKADYKVIVGQIDPHQIVGFTDSVSGFIIGCSGEATIEHNHSLMFNEGARVGVLAGNPVRKDINQAAEMVDINLAIDFVLAPNKDVIKIIAGHPVDTLLDGVAVASELFGVTIDKQFDIVVASCGGYPKDRCLYQAQKGLNLASQAVKPGGHILLLAALSQGVGDDIYFDYVSQFTTPEDVLSDFRNQRFRMGAHKAFLYGRTLCEFDVAVHSELDQGVLKKCHLRAADPTQVIAEWLGEEPHNKTVGIITSANTTYFFEENKTNNFP